MCAEEVVKSAWTPPCGSTSSGSLPASGKARGVNGNAPFKVSPSLDRVTTCSRECGYKVRRVANKTEHVTLKCGHCSGLFTSFPSQAERRVFCSRKCMHESAEFAQRKGAIRTGEQNPAWKGGATTTSVSASGRVYRRQPQHVEAEKSVRRRNAQGQATPPWADISAIRSIYREAARLTKATGEPHHVDHVVPLISPVVCGLHTQSNLQVLPASINLSKGNRLSA